jgi:hypothetical protein
LSQYRKKQFDIIQKCHKILYFMPWVESEAESDKSSIGKEKAGLFK